MALPILDGNQSATTLSTILDSGQHIPAHTVVSFGSTAISNITSAVSGSVVSISNFPASQSTTFGAVTGSVSVLNFPSTQTVAGTVTANGVEAQIQDALFGNDSLVNNLNEYLVLQNNVPISGTVTAGNLPIFQEGLGDQICVRVGGVGIDGALLTEVTGTVKIVSEDSNPIIPISGTVTANNSVLSNVLDYDGNNYFIRIGGRTAAGRTDYPIGIAGTITVGNSVTIASLPAISGTVTASPVQGTSVTTSNFTSTTASTTLVSANSARRGLTVFNEGAGNLHICAGATATTVAYQIRLSAGDYWECPTWQTSLTHSAQFASSGTARVTEII
jgi:hypothetical protein